MEPQISCLQRKGHWDPEKIPFSESCSGRTRSSRARPTQKTLLHLLAWKTNCNFFRQVLADKESKQIFFCYVMWYSFFCNWKLAWFIFFINQVSIYDYLIFARLLAGRCRPFSWDWQFCQHSDPDSCCQLCLCFQCLEQSWYELNKY